MSDDFFYDDLGQNLRQRLGVLGMEAWKVWKFLYVNRCKCIYAWRNEVKEGIASEAKW